tara:strand:- start:2529 stop:3500 length:972 start_codon:yes stop_codon:yes gene_type:complete
MDDKKIKAITKPFSKDEIKKAPKGKFGDYVPHHLVTARLNKYAFGEWSHTLKEVIRNHKGEVRAVVTTFTLWGVSHDEIGDVDNTAVNNNNTEGELLKLCMSDALKRGAMRHGIGLHLWTGDITEEEHYYTTPKQDTVEVTKIDKRKKENKSSEEVKAITEESIAKFEQDIGYNKETSLNNAKQIAKIIEGFGLPKDIENKAKQTSFTQFISQGNDKDVEKWDNNTIGQYLDLFEQLANEMADNSSDTDIVEEVFGEVKDLSVKIHPNCDKKTCAIEDNREKKASNPDKFGKIPDFACSNYNNASGCGKGWWIGNADLPTEWL